MRFPATSMLEGHRLRVATYNIHKGVRGIGGNKRLEIHDLGLAIEALDADLVFLQEVRHFHRGEARHFDRSSFGWPSQGQAHFLAPEGYEVAYRTNAVTAQGEHGNALLSRWSLGEVSHQDISDHRFEQRGLLHAHVAWDGVMVHAIVAHLALMHASRVRQVDRIAHFIETQVPPQAPLILAGDFNDWGERLDVPMQRFGLKRALAQHKPVPRTFPSRLPLFSLDRVYTRGFRCENHYSPRGPLWVRMSDHLPLLADLVLE